MFALVPALLAGVSALAMALALAAQPALADTELGHSGIVGTHSLEDFALAPGATCKYRFVHEAHSGKLFRIVAGPPLMRAASGETSQTVGWKFTVERRVHGIGGALEWVKRYASAEMTAVTDATHDAPFTKATVPVHAGPLLAGGMYEYRVLVTMMWHAQDGSVQGRARHRVDYYASVIDTGGTGVQSNNCDAYWRPAAEG